MSRKRSVFRSPFLWFLVLCLVLVMSGAISGENVFNNGVGRTILSIILAALVWAMCWAVDESVSSKRVRGLVNILAFIIIIVGIALQWTWLIGPEKTVLTNRYTWESRRAEGPQLINPFTTRVTDLSYVYLTHEATGISAAYELDTARLVETYMRFGSQDSLAAFMQREFQKQVDGFVDRCGSTDPYCILCQFTADSLDFPNGRVRNLHVAL